MSRARTVAVRVINTKIEEQEWILVGLQSKQKSQSKHLGGGQRRGNLRGMESMRNRIKCEK